MLQSLSIIILSAGKGSRMRSNLPKVMHKIANKRMIDMVIEQSINLNPRDITIVISEDIKPFENEIIEHHQNSLKNHKISLQFTIQKERLGTAHAVSCGINHLKNCDKKLGDKVLILYGDTPLISSATLNKMLENLDQSGLCVLAFENDEENSYGRLILDDQEHLLKIVEFKDANDSERKISLCNSGVIAIDGKQLENLIPKIDNKNSAQEFYLTDIISIAQKHGIKRSFIKTNNLEVLGVNSRSELAKIEKIKQKQLRKKMLENGVTLIDPKTVYFSYDTEVDFDVIINPNVIFGTNVKIDNNVEIKSFCHIEGAHIKSGSVIGPFARIRPQTKIDENVKIGNFVEVKKSTIKKGAKINHLSYIGDCEVGENSNIGAGTITCNYDGYNKNKTIIGKDVFIGSNSCLIAPISVGNSAVIGAGSIITKNISDGDLAVSRVKQDNLKNGGIKYHQKKLNKND